MCLRVALDLMLSEICKGQNEQRSKPLCRGLHLGLNCVVPAKAKTQLAKTGRKLREDQVDRHRREIFAKVADWPILVAKHCKLSHVRPNTAQAQRKQFCQMFTTRKPGMWSRKHCENTCESTMRV